MFNTNKLIVSIPNQDLKGRGSMSRGGTRSLHAASGRLAEFRRGRIGSASGRMNSASMRKGSASSRMKGPLNVASVAHVSADIDATVLDVGTGGDYTAELCGVDVGGCGGAGGYGGDNGGYDGGGGGFD